MSVRMNLVPSVKATLVTLGLYVMLLLFLLTLLAGQAQAKTIYYGSAAEQVRVSHGGPTIFRFVKAVQTITNASRFQIKPANAADPSYQVLSVTPRFTNGLNEVSFFLADGQVVKTKIVVSPNDPAADSYYDFKPKDGGDSSEAENAPKINEIELMKAMVRDDEVSGYKINRMSSAGRSKIAEASVELIRIYRGSPFNGYVYRVTNTSWRKNVEIDVRHIVVGEPNLAILSQSDESLLHPKGKGVYQTLVRVVAKNTASSNDVILAMEPQESQAKKGE